MQKRLILTIIGLIIFSHFSFAQIDSLKAANYKNKAISFLTEGEVDSASYYTNKAIQFYNETCDLENWMYLHQKLGLVHRKKHKDYKNAMQSFNKAIEVAEFQSLNVKEYNRLAWVYAHLGFTYRELNDQHSIIKYYGLSAAIFVDTLHDEGTNVAFYVYSQLGNAYNRLRDYTKAYYYHDRSVKILRKAAKWSLAGSAYNDLGMVYFNQENYAKSIETYLEGLEISTLDFDSKVMLLSNIGLAYLKNKEYDKAVAYTRECEQFILSADVSAFEKEEALIWVYANFGKYFKALGRFEKAAAYFLKAIAKAKTTGVENRRTLALLKISLGNLFVVWKKPNIALSYFKEGVDCFIFDNKSMIPNPNQLLAEPTLIDAFGGMANAFQLLNDNKPSVELASNIMKCYGLALDIEKKLMQFYVLTHSRVSALEEYRWVKEEAVSFLYDQWKKMPTDSLAQDMFTLSEQSRAVLLLENRNINHLITHKETGALRDEYLFLNKAIENLEYDLYHFSGGGNKKNKLTKEVLEKELISTREAKAKIIAEISALYPDFDGINTRKNIKLAHIKKDLSADHVLVEYFIAEDAVFVFTIDANHENVDIKKVKWNTEWSKLAQNLNQNIFEQQNEVYVKNAYLLFEHLVAPVLNFSNAKHLIIIPDGVLWNIPFATLLTNVVPPKEADNFRILPYLINKKQISYAFSTILLKEMEKESQKVEAFNFLAIGPSYWKQNKTSPRPTYYASRSSLDTLIHNQDEAVEIAELLNGEYFTAEFATKKQFFNKLSTTNIIHIAAHAKVNRQIPDLSFIAFSNTGDTLHNPYKLYVHEIYKYFMPFEMLVLSACETGTGPIWKGEGQISLARAFAYSGAKSMITSMWSIDDKATKNLMVQFYQNLNKGFSKDIALRMAQQHFIKQAVDNSRAHPRYWAAFTALGNMKSIDLNRNNSSSFPFYLFFVVIIVGGVGFFKWKLV